MEKIREYYEYYIGKDYFGIDIEGKGLKRKYNQYILIIIGVILFTIFLFIAELCDIIYVSDYGVRITDVHSYRSRYLRCSL